MEDLLTSYPPVMAEHTMGNDEMRISQIKELIADGYLDKILISQDICYKINLSSYGDGGYALIPTAVIPVMLNSRHYWSTNTYQHSQKSKASLDPCLTNHVNQQKGLTNHRIWVWCIKRRDFHEVASNVKLSQNKLGGDFMVWYQIEKNAQNNL